MGKDVSERWALQADCRWVLAVGAAGGRGPGQWPRCELRASDRHASFLPVQYYAILGVPKGTSDDGVLKKGGLGASFAA